MAALGRALELSEGRGTGAAQALELSEGRRTGLWCRSGRETQVRNGVGTGTVSVSPWVQETGFSWLGGTKGILHPEPLPLHRPLLACTSTGDTQALKGRFGSVSVGYPGPGAHKLLFEPSKHLWQVWGLILNMISSLLQSC